MPTDPSWKMGERNGLLPTGGASDRLPGRGSLDDLDDLNSVYAPERRPVNSNRQQVESEYKEK